MRTILKIEGLHCASCKAVIEDIASDFPDIGSANVDVAGGTAAVEHEDGFDLGRFAEEIHKLGQYRVVGSRTS